MKKNKVIKWQGFTLVELMVVISIIAILTGMLLVAYQGTRATARDGKRKADLEQIRIALQMYHADCGSYPLVSEISFGGALTSTCLVTPVTYMSQLPTDPNPSYSYRYEVGAGRNTYQLCTRLETGGASPCLTACTGDCGIEACNYFTCQP